MSYNSIKCFLVLAKNMTSGVDFPNPNARALEKSQNLCKYLMQQSLSKEIIMIMLFISSKIGFEYEPYKRQGLTSILKYSQKECIPHGFFLSKYLLDNSLND